MTASNSDKNISSISGTDNTDSLVAAIDTAGEALSRVKSEIGNAIFGQDRVIEQTLITLLAGGHTVLVGEPGLAKTLLVDSVGRVLGLNTKRVQFTPDLMPADILGSEVLEESAAGKREFRFIKGPIFTQLLMADEINRASPRTQSALLQAMQEHHVTIAGQRHDLPAPFHVLATQNPIEQEGTYPLPEAQLDRFLMQIDVHHPDIDAERRVLLETTGNDQPELKSILRPGELQDMQKLVRQMPLSNSVTDAILTLVRSARPSSASEDVAPLISWGPGPRASQALALTIRARAMLDGRLAPSVDDVLDLAEPVLKHRMALSYAAHYDGLTIPALVARLSEQIK
ncbi:MAG: MoxR family ATPase [Cohaesibacteraceae bacterium]|nr:MoxR family ATPase [Cohaesibacteraceae bacterium]